MCKCTKSLCFASKKCYSLNYYAFVMRAEGTIGWVFAFGIYSAKLFPDNYFAWFWRKMLCANAGSFFRIDKNFKLSLGLYKLSLCLCKLSLRLYKLSLSLQILPPETAFPPGCRAGCFFEDPVKDTRQDRIGASR